MERLCVYNYSVYEYEGRYFSKVDFLDWLSILSFNISATVVVCPIKFLNTEEETIGLIQLPECVYFNLNSFKDIWRVIRCIRTFNWFHMKVWQTSSIFWFYLTLMFKVESHVVIVGDSARSFSFRKDLIPSKSLRTIMSKLVLWVVRDIAKRASLVVCVSDDLVYTYCQSSKNVVVASESWLDESVLLESTLANEISERSQDNEMKVLYVGRIVHEKGLRELILAIKKLRENKVPISLSLIGTGKNTDELKSLSESYGLNDFILFLGYIENNSKELYQYYRNADVFVLPSYSEGTPLSILEAFACQTLVVATRVGGIPAMLDNERGVLLQTPSPDIIKDVLEGIYWDYSNNLPKIDLMKSNAFDWVFSKTRIKERQKMYSATYDK